MAQGGTGCGERCGERGPVAQHLLCAHAVLGAFQTHRSETTQLVVERGSLQVSKQMLREVN